MPDLPTFRTSQTRTGTRAIPREAPLPPAAPLPPSAADVAGGAIGKGLVAAGRGLDDVSDDLLRVELEKQKIRDNTAKATGKGNLENFIFDRYKTIRGATFNDPTEIKEARERFDTGYDGVVEIEASKMSENAARDFRDFAEQNKTRYMRRVEPMFWAKESGLGRQLAEKRMTQRFELLAEFGTPWESILGDKELIAEINSGYGEYFKAGEFESLMVKNLSSALTTVGRYDDARNLVQATKVFTPAEKRVLNNIISTEEKSLQAQADADLKAKQNETARNLLVSLWDGTLTDIALRSATETGLLTYEKAKGLRLALTQPKEFNLTSYIKVKNAVNSYERGRTSFDDALVILTENASLLGDEGKGLTDKLFAMPNKNEADWEAEGIDYIQSQILEKDIFGRFYGTPVEQTAALEARLAYDVALETAIRKGEPIEGRDKLILAHDIMLKYRPEKEEKPPVELEKGLGTIPFISDADIDKAIKQAKENLGEKATPQEIKAEVMRLLK